MTRMGLLNNYLAYLPMVNDSSMAVEDTKKGNVPFNKADLAGIVFKAIPTSWVNQYNLTHLTLSKSLRLLLPDLENIKYVMNEKHAKSAKARGKDGTALAGAKSSPKKRASMGSASKSLRKLAPGSSASIARTMVGPTHPIIPKSVASTTRTERL
jgi:hypothetical protein